jgi:hypothetical protein
MTGLELIAEERQRQLALHHSQEQDDKYVKQQLCAAAECYEQAGDQLAVGNDVSPCPPATWPWSSQYWRPSGNNVRNWIKAGALYRAEAERYLRRNVAMCRMNCDGHANRCAIKIDLALAGTTKAQPSTSDA